MQATHIPGPEVSKMVKRELMRCWPGVKFSVRYGAYAGGSSIDVAYTDGPPLKDVQRVCDKFEGAEFDGSIDLQSYRTHAVTTNGVTEVVRFDVDYVQPQRSLSPAVVAELRARVEELHGVTWSDRLYQHTDWFHQLSEATDYTPLKTAPSSQIQGPAHKVISVH